MLIRTCTALSNPNEIASFSPGLPRRAGSYPGLKVARSRTMKGFRGENSQKDSRIETPERVCNRDWLRFPLSPSEWERPGALPLK